MKKGKRYLGILFLCLLLTACTNANTGKEKQKDTPQKRPYYISFTVTKEENNELHMYNYTYDMESKAIEERTMLTYYAQYPLTVYSMHDHAVYYAGRDKKGCDQLHRLNLKTMKDETLSDDLFAINFILPIQEKLYVVAVLKGQRALGFFEIKNGERKRILLDEDASVGGLNVNPKTQSIVYNTSSQSELDWNMEHDEMGVDGSGDGKNQIWEFHYENEALENRTTTQTGYLRKIGLQDNHDIYYLLRDKWNLVQDKKSIPTEELDHLHIEEIVYMDDEDIFYTDDMYRLMQYHKANKKETVIFAVKETKAALNNAIVLPKTPTE